MTARTVHVDAARLQRWVAGFTERHGPVDVAAADDAVRLVAADGSQAALHVLFPPLPADGESDPVVRLARHAAAERRTLVLLVRRGGYACAVVEGRRVTASKVGSRYVQSRTAAGGWSQQRFARRREGQTRTLVQACAEVATRLLVPQEADTLVTGGDRPLVEQVLADPRLMGLSRLPRGPHLDVGDPRADVVRALPERLHAVPIAIREIS